MIGDDIVSEQDDRRPPDRDALGRAAALLAAAGLGASRAFLAERERWLLWLPVLAGAGVALYFLSPVEPARWAGVLWLIFAILMTMLGRRRAVVFVLGLGLIAVGLGFTVAGWRAASVAAPVLTKRLGPVEVRGRVSGISVLGSGSRLILERLDIPRLAPQPIPKKVRVVVRAKGDPERPVWPGDWVSLRAVLYPPPEPSAPGAFDFARQAFFKGLGGVGYAVSGVRWVDPPDGEGSGGFAAWLAGLRQTVTGRVRGSLKEPAGAIAAALMTGERGAIPDDVLAAIRDSGLAHLLAISGLHIGLVAGLLFLAVRAALALIEPVALRYPIKKWSAAVALVGAFAYLLLSGASISTQRAFLMLTLVMLAVMLDRAWVSMRLVAWAAAVVLLLAPESLLGPSFQMSFAAVIALVAAYERCGERFTAWRAGAGRPRRVAIYLTAVALTTVVATLATTPFAIFHFNRLVIFGLAANLVAVPLTALWIMPWAMVAFLFMPFGLEGVALTPMGWGIDALIVIAKTVASWPGAVWLLPAMPVAGLAAVSVGGLWLCLWRGRWRLLGMLGIAAGLATLGIGRGPDILVDGSGRLFAARAESGEFMLSSRRTARTTGEFWLRRNGQREALPWPKQGASEDGRLSCDSLGCIYQSGSHMVALVQDPRALRDDCQVASVVVSLVPVRGRCPAATVVVDRFDLWRRGAHAIWLEVGGVRVETVASYRGRRLWAPGRGD